ncbi:TD and POZ domain-containing protein 4 [Caerostris extrusa]|uniref:TD and POZ domain-containing protein 4 n=1 Tax=Caerostris extrusa TaxID=172846 RepID=A0AAV4TWA6_CAEEX|nr:TD and POZ domain-containing protein 4 [Caerostris extrusa]
MELNAVSKWQKESESEGKIGIYLNRMSSDKKCTFRHIQTEFSRCPEDQTQHHKLRTYLRANCSKTGDDIGSELTELNQYQPQRTTILNTESLSNDLKSLYNNDMFSDLTLRVGNEDLQLHKCILASRSNVFHKMFKHNMKENLTNSLEISDIDPAIVKMMVCYMYCGQVKNLNVEVAIQLYSAAENTILRI